MARGFRIASAYVEISAKTDKQQMRRSAERVGKQGGGAYSSGFGAAAGAGMRRNADRAHAPMRDASGRFSKAGAAGGGAFASGFGASAAAGMGRATKGAESQVRDTSGKFSSAGQEGGKGFTKGTKAGLAGFGAAFTPVTAAISVVTGLLGGAVLGAAGDFEFAMNGVRAVTGATGKDFKDLERLAKDLGSSTQFSGSQAANAMEFLGMAGWDTRQIMAGLPDVLDLAAAGNMDLARAADISSNAMSAFGMEADESQRVADALAYAASNANVTVDGLGMSMSKSAGAASSAGWSIEQTTAALGLFGDVGILAEESGTGLAAMLGEVMDEGSTAAEVFNRFGVEVQNADGSTRDLADILADAKDAGMKFNDATEAFGSDHGKKFATMLGLSTEHLEASKFAADDAADSANTMGETRMEGLQGALTTIKSAMEGLAIAVADMGILDFATGAAEKFGSAIQGLTGWLSENSAMIRPIVQAVGVFAGAVAGVLGVLVAVKVAVAAFGAVLAVVASPVALVAAAVGLLAVGLWMAWKRSETFRDVVTKVFSKVKEAWSALWDKGLKPGLAALMATFKENWPAIKDMALEAFQAIMAKVEEIRPHVEKIVGQITEFWEAHGEKIVEALKVAFGIAVDRVKSVFKLVIAVIKGAWQIISGIWSGAFQMLGGIFDVFAGLFTGDWARLWDGVKSIFKGLWTAVTGIFKGAVTILGGIVKFLVDSIKKPFLALWNWLVGNSLVPDLVKAVFDWFKKMRDWVTNTVKSLVDRVVRFFTNLRDRGAAVIAALRDWVLARVGQLRDRFIAVHVAMRDRALAVLSALRDRARAIADNIRDWITSRVTTLRDRIVNRFESIRDRAISAFTKAKDGIKDVWKKLKSATKDPVNFVIETVYTKGIKKFWDSIADKLGSSVGNLPTITKLATGGRTQGGTPGVDSIPALLMADEYVVKKSAAQRIGYDNLEYMNQTGEMPVQKFSKGGIVGAVGDFISKGKDFFADGFMKAVRAVTTPIISTLKDEFGTSGFKGLPTKIVQHIVGKLHSFLSPFEDSLSGGDGGGVVKVAREQVGISGRPNKFTRAPGMWTDEWCFAAGTLVLTPAGHRPIETLTVGDKVTTPTGATIPIATVLTRTKPLLELTALGVAATRVTEDHPYWARRGKHGSPEWIKAGLLERGDMIALPLHKPVGHRVDPAVAYFLGMYTADGHRLHHSRGVQISDAPADVSRIVAACEAAGFAPHVTTNRTCSQVTVYGAEAYDLAGLCGDLAHGKQVPMFILDGDQEAREAFLAGYLAGDGHQDGRGVWQCGTVSRALAVSLAELLRSLGHVPNVRLGRRGQPMVIEGRTVQTRDYYHVTYKPGADRSRSQWYMEDGVLWVPVRSVVETGESATVYDLTVPGEHAFIADGAWVHNCGMFVDWVFKKANAFNAISSVKGTPAVRNYTTLNSVGKGAMKAGDLALYRGDTGHINIVTDPKTGETVGGNESNAVGKKFGYVNSASSIRRPKFASGGLVDAAAVQRAGGLDELRAVSWQDGEETPDRFLTSAERRRRDLFSPLPELPATHDDGGVVLDKHAGVNRRGEAELMVLRDEMRQWVAAARGGGDTYNFAPGSVVIPARDLKEMQDVREFLDRIQQTARQHGARTRVGAPR